MTLAAFVKIWWYGQPDWYEQAWERGQKWSEMSVADFCKITVMYSTANEPCTYFATTAQDMKWSHWR